MPPGFQGIVRAWLHGLAVLNQLRNALRLGYLDGLYDAGCVRLGSFMVAAFWNHRWGARLGC